MLFEKYDILSKRINRHFLRIISILIPLITIITSASIYAINDASFSFLTHYLSHLGGGPEGAGIVFNVGIMTSGFLMVFFFLNLSAFLRRKKTNTLLIYIAFIPGLLSSIGTFFVGVFPYTVTQELHNFSATFFFMGGFAYCVLYGVSEWITEGISKLQASLGFVVALFFLLFIIFTAINYFNPHLAAEQSHITEWMLISMLMFWIIEHEATMTRDKRNNLKPS
ncbi:MAG: DUF998 domain-containing protein [Candidatus Lokiarchaeota archaeon]|nr:DUF998 domain-containing protein [Candidatus Lokiarchaeota archaeon]